MPSQEVCQEMLAVLKEIVRIWKGPRERAGMLFREAIARAETVIARAEQEPSE